ncbi:RNase H-like domain-containing protein, partial [Shigella flexneri]|nr:RNase H-like domain-containing protein [Shigella flexneri]
PEEPLYLYLAVGDEAVSAVLVREDGTLHKPIYYVSKVLQGPELRYLNIEKLALALVTTAKRLRPYFKSHTVTVLTNYPLRQVLTKPDVSGR